MQDRADKLLPLAQGAAVEVAALTVLGVAAVESIYLDKELTAPRVQ